MGKIVRVFIGFSFVIYLFALVIILFLRSRGYYSEIPLFEYIKRSTNLIPFKTITQMITAYETD